MNVVRIVAGFAAVGAIAVLGLFANRAADPVREVVPDDRDLAKLYQRAAHSGGGQRVVVIAEATGGDSSAQVFETLEGPSGWALVKPVPAGSEELLPTLDRLARAVALDWDGDRRLDEATVRALVHFGVSIVVAHDVHGAILPETREYDPALKVREGIPGLAISKAGPVFQLLAAPESLEDAGSPVEFARRVRRGDAQFGNYTDLGWGGRMTIRSYGESEFAFAWPAAGAQVTVDGQPVEAKSTTLPLLVVTLPDGEHEVEVRYGADDGRSWMVIGAAVVLLLAVAVFLLSIRSSLVAGAETQRVAEEEAARVAGVPSGVDVVADVDADVDADATDL